MVRRKSRPYYDGKIHTFVPEPSPDLSSTGADVKIYTDPYTIKLHMPKIQFPVGARIFNVFGICVYILTGSV